MRNILLFFMLAAFLADPAAAADFAASTAEDQTAVEVTVYNSNLGLVKDTRRIDPGAGEGELRFMDVAAHIIPVTVHIQSLTAPEKFAVLEQNYEYDLMDYNKMLDKFVGREIKLLTRNQYTDKEETVAATLLSNNSGQPIYKIGGEIHLGHPGYRILPEIPDNLIAKPTLMWMYKNSHSGGQDIQVSYLTNNINWNADYVMVLDKDDKTAGMNGWVSVDNRSGASYENAKLTLVAGTVNRANVFRQELVEMDRMRAMEAAAAPQFQEESFFEYHVYNLQRPTTIKNNQIKQISLLEAEGVGVRKIYRVLGTAHYYYRMEGGQNKKIPVNVKLKFKNSQDNHMGMPLPAGVVRLYKKDSRDSLQFIGEDRIKHTPKDEEIELQVGEAFDVVAERVQMDYQRIGSRIHENEWEVTIRNHKEEDIVVEVVEPLQGDWQMLSNTHPYEKIDAFHVKFKVPAARDKEVKVKYRFRVHY